MSNVLIDHEDDIKQMNKKNTTSIFESVLSKIAQMIQLMKMDHKTLAIINGVWLVSYKEYQISYGNLSGIANTVQAIYFTG